MAAKFYDFLKNLTSSKDSKGSAEQIDKELPAMKLNRATYFNRVNDELKKMSEAAKEAASSYDQLSEAWVKGGKTDDALRAKVKTAEEEAMSREKKRAEAAANMQREFRLTDKQMEGVTEKIEKQTTVNAKYAAGLDTVTDITFEAKQILKGFTVEMGLFGEILNMTVSQMIDLNRRVIEFNRSMGGAFTMQQAGFDSYGNSKQGSLQSITGANNIDIKQYTEALYAFGKGNVVGLTENIDAAGDSLRHFGVDAARLSKYYNVSMDDIAKATGNMVYNYGVKIEALSDIFENGKEAAFAAGLNVSEYFKNLAAASDKIGEVFIAGGVDGLQKMAMFATKMQISISTMTGMLNNFQSFTSIYEKQNTAVALGLQATAARTAKVWAELQNGKFPEANRDFVTGLAQDIKRLGYIDKDTGQLDNRGIKTLTAMNANKEQILAVQNLIRKQNELRLTFEQLTDVEKQSLETKMRIAAYENRNSTFSEKLNMIWEQLKAVLITPLSNLLSPVLDILVNGILGAVSTLSLVLTPVMWGFNLIGKVLGTVASAFSWLIGGMTAIFKSLSFWFDKTSNSFGSLIKAVGAVVAVLLTIKGIGMASNFITAGVEVAGGVMGRVKRFVTGKGLTEAETSIASSVIGSAERSGPAKPAANRIYASAGEKTMMSVNKYGSKVIGRAGRGFGIGAIGSLVGLGVGMIPGGQKLGDGIGTVSNFAGAGFALGGPIGAGIGAVIGLGAASWDKISKVWSDGSKSIWGKIAGSIMAIFEQIGDMFSDLFKTDADKKKDFAAAHLNAVGSSIDMGKIIGQRTIQNSNEATLAQERIMQHSVNHTTTVVNVTPMFSGSVKQKITR